MPTFKTAGHFYFLEDKHKDATSQPSYDIMPQTVLESQG